MESFTKIVFLKRSDLLDIPKQQTKLLGQAIMPTPNLNFAIILNNIITILLGSTQPIHFDCRV